MELILNDRIRQRSVAQFNSFRLSLRYNSIASTFGFDFYYDPNVQEQKEMACVGHYHICKIYHLGQLLITGQVLSEAFRDSSIRQLVPIGGYSLPGILEDCSIPTQQAIQIAKDNGNLKLAGTALPFTPLQSTNLSLRQIAQQYLTPFGIQMVVDPAVAAEMDSTFDETNAKPKDSVKHYLTELCTQKNINITHDEYGRVVFTKIAKAMKPILDFDTTTEPTGSIPGVSFELHFNGQGMHSQITVVKEADPDEPNAGENTVNNPYVPFVFRPKTIVQSSGTDIDTLQAARNARADELRNLTLTVRIERWDVSKKIIRPNNTITVKNPNVYLFKKTEWFIEGIDYEGDEKQMVATLHCVQKCVYDDTDPVYIFQGINLRHG